MNLYLYAVIALWQNDMYITLSGYLVPAPVPVGYLISLGLPRDDTKVWNKLLKNDGRKRAPAKQGSPRGSCPLNSCVCACVCVKMDLVALVEPRQTSEVQLPVQLGCRLRRCSWFGRRKKKLRRYRQCAVMLQFYSCYFIFTYFSVDRHRVSHE